MQIKTTEDVFNLNIQNDHERQSCSVSDCSDDPTLKIPDPMALTRIHSYSNMKFDVFFLSILINLSGIYIMQNTMVRGRGEWSAGEIIIIRS